MALDLAYTTVAPTTVEEQIICGAYSAYDFLNSPEGRELLQKDETEEVVDYYELERFFINESINLYEVPNPHIYYATIYAILAYYKSPNFLQEKANQYNEYLRFIISQARVTKPRPLNGTIYTQADYERCKPVHDLALEYKLSKSVNIPGLYPLPDLQHFHNPEGAFGLYNSESNTIWINLAHRTIGSVEYIDTIRHELTHVAQTRYVIFEFLKEAAAENSTQSPEVYKQARNLTELIQHSLQLKIPAKTLEELTFYKHDPKKALNLFSKLLSSFANNSEILLDLMRTVTLYTASTQAPYGRCIPSVAANTIMYKHVLPNIKNIVPYSLSRIAHFYTQITGYEAPLELFAQIKEAQTLFSKKIIGPKQTLLERSPDTTKTWREKNLPPNPPVSTLRKSIAARLKSLLPKDQ